MFLNLDHIGQIALMQEAPKGYKPAG